MCILVILAKRTNKLPSTNSRGSLQVAGSMRSLGSLFSLVSFSRRRRVLSCVPVYRSVALWRASLAAIISSLSLSLGRGGFPWVILCPLSLYAILWRPFLPLSFSRSLTRVSCPWRGPRFVGRIASPTRGGLGTLCIFSAPPGVRYVGRP